ncbi:DUF1349 domain-containing protein [Vibrio sp. JC009]|uniref:DUF1349 domain-containing protein n=1 Tax=Vibrio sp. JC009 TaxID=2912314 RepID=UPI0023B0BD73|nr:DUF1349 domain-containing protein [Vibrio sp. JC009]WED23743.1 DUF1349 domain-containing protein [Vibrio sp. JC009]
MNNMKNWNILNNNPVHWQSDDKALKIQVSEGNIWGSDAEVDNIFVHPVEKNRYSAQVEINLIPQKAFEQGGLGVFWDKNNYIKISKEMFNGRLSLVFVTEQDGYPQVNHLIDYPESDVTLKLEKQDDQVTALYQIPSEDSWHSMGTVQALPGSEQGVMLYTFSGSVQQPTIATFSGFSLNYL